MRGRVSRKHGPIPSGLDGRDQAGPQPELRKRDGCLFGEIAGVVGLFYAIGIRAFLHPFGVIVIGTITATPCRLAKDFGLVGVRKTRIKQIVKTKGKKIQPMSGSDQGLGKMARTGRRWVRPSARERSHDQSVFVMLASPRERGVGGQKGGARRAQH